jgi:hypothetical protein
MDDDLTNGKIQIKEKLQNMSNSNEQLLPYAYNAVVEIRKLRDYCLNTHHKSGGKDKARLFYSALGMTVDDAEQLRIILLNGVQSYPAKLGKADEYGQRYTVNIQVIWGGKSALLLSGWIIKYESDIPKLTTCYPL